MKRVLLAFLALALPALSHAAGPRILMLVTSANQLDAQHPTGLWLEEFTAPYLIFKKAGAEITVVSPQGGSAPIDARSNPTPEQAEAWKEAIAELKTTRKLGPSFKAADFDALFIPGGHGTMVDFPVDPAVAAVVEDFANSGKVVTAVCHGPAALAGAKTPAGEPLVKGRTITGFTDAEERAVKLDAAVPFLLEEKLSGQGAKFIAGENFKAHIQVDGKLITGQNPPSSEPAAEATLKMLGAK